MNFFFNILFILFKSLFINFIYNYLFINRLKRIFDII